MIIIGLELLLHPNLSSADLLVVPTGTGRMHTSLQRHIVRPLRHINAIIFMLSLKG